MAPTALACFVPLRSSQVVGWLVALSEGLGPSGQKAISQRLDGGRCGAEGGAYRAYQDPRRGVASDQDPPRPAAAAAGDLGRAVDQVSACFAGQGGPGGTLSGVAAFRGASRAAGGLLIVQGSWLASLASIIFVSSAVSAAATSPVG